VSGMDRQGSAAMAASYLQRIHISLSRCNGWTILCTWSGLSTQEWRMQLCAHCRVSHAKFPCKGPMQSLLCSAYFEPSTVEQTTGSVWSRVGVVELDRPTVEVRARAIGSPHAITAVCQHFFLPLNLAATLFLPSCRLSPSALFAYTRHLSPDIFFSAANHHVMKHSSFGSSPVLTPLHHYSHMCRSSTYVTL
jgi:hypothetical protein